MDHHCREKGARNIYSNYNQMRAYVECSPDQSKKIIPYPPFHRAIDETLKILEKCQPFLCLHFTKVLDSGLPAHAYKMVITAYVYK